MAPVVAYQLPLFPHEKRCTDCGQTKSVDDFYRMRRARDGLQGRCKECTRRRREAHYAANREAYRERNSAYHQANRERLLANNREYCKKTADVRRERHRAWRLENLERQRAYEKAYQHSHLAGHAVHQRLRAARKRSAEGSHTTADVHAIYEQQQGKCYYCACLLHGRYHVDHKQPISKHGSEWPENLACTCHTCNLRKANKTEEEFKALLRREHAPGEQFRMLATETKA